MATTSSAKIVNISNGGNLKFNFLSLSHFFATAMMSLFRGGLVQYFRGRCVAHRGEDMHEIRIPPDCAYGLVWG